MLFGNWYTNYTAPSRTYIEQTTAVPAQQIIRNLNGAYQDSSSLRNLKLIGWRAAVFQEAPTTAETQTPIEPSVGPPVEVQSETFAESAGGIALFSALGVIIIVLVIIAIIKWAEPKRKRKYQQVDGHHHQWSAFGWGEPMPGWSAKMSNLYEDIEGKPPPPPPTTFLCHFLPFSYASLHSFATFFHITKSNFHLLFS